MILDTFENRYLLIVILHLLIFIRGGIKIENRENLGQCHNRVHHFLYNVVLLMVLDNNDNRGGGKKT